MDYKGTKTFTIEIINSSMFIDNAPVGGYKVYIRNRKTGKAVIAMFTKSYALATKYSYRTANDLELEVEALSNNGGGQQLPLIK